jgi:hypothetical protein
MPGSISLQNGCAASTYVCIGASAFKVGPHHEFSCQDKPQNSIPHFGILDYAAVCLSWTHFFCQLRSFVSRHWHFILLIHMALRVGVHPFWILVNNYHNNLNQFFLLDFISIGKSDLSCVTNCPVEKMMEHYTLFRVCYNTENYEKTINH